MCGICGVLNFDGQPTSSAMLEEMVRVIQHRGPDESGVCCEGNLGLGHTRLSIIDIAGGQQPMRNETGNLIIVFNGEIFNYLELREELERAGHRFSSKSDTEVILRLYEAVGEKCVQRFNGQWAFAIWDCKRKTLFLSRDRLGVRPLFFTQVASSFLFASEMKSLLASGMVRAEIDLQGLDQVFTFWTTIPPRTIFKNIHQLPPGCSLSIHGSDLRTRRYWSLEYPRPASAPAFTEEQSAEQLLGLLSDATRIRLRSDVPVGAYLSGGIDSTVVTALAQRHARDRLRSFSIVFNDPAYDESRYQQEAANFLATCHSSFSCSTNDIAEALPDVVWHCEQPILRTAPTPMYLLSEFVRNSGFKVVLSGEGADEILGGYDIFKEAKIRRFWGQVPSSRLRPLLLKRLYPYMENMQRQSPAFLQHFFRVSQTELANPYFSHLPRWELTVRLKLLYSVETREQLRDYNPFDDLAQSLPADFRSWTPFNQAEYLEATGLMPGYILSAQGDRMAMAHSVEGRFPFLDHRVVELATKLPPDLKMRGIHEKYLLKKAASRIVPDLILKRSKQPYRAPEGRCFFGGGQPNYVSDLLSADAINGNRIFDARAITTLVGKFTNGIAQSTRDNMALLGALSTQLLISQFVSTEWRESAHANIGDSSRYSRIYRNQFPVWQR